jgi:FkbM family methyltransferase
MFTLTYQLIAVLTCSDISIVNRLLFIIFYPYSLIVTFLQKTLKYTIAIDFNKFYFTGNHNNVFLDHLYYHLKTLMPFYKNAQLIIDVGASFGTFPRIAKFFNPNVLIYCFEMTKLSYDVLFKNTSNLKNTYIANNAIGKSIKLIKYYTDQEFPEGSSINNVKATDKIMQITLDSFVIKNKIKDISILKIDTEGYEINVLKGAKKTLKMVKTLIIETDLEPKNLQTVMNLCQLEKFRLVNFGEANFSRKFNRIESVDLIFNKENK